MNDTSKKIFIGAFLLSLLLHGLIFLLFLFSDFNLFANIVEPEPEKKIRVKLQKRNPPPAPVPTAEPVPPEQQPQPQIPETFTRLVENPNANEKNPDRTSLLSDKSSVSAAPEAADRTELTSVPVTDKSSKSVMEEHSDNPVLNEIKTPYKTFSKGMLTTRLAQILQEKKEKEKKEKKEKSEKAENNAPSTPESSKANETKVFDPKEVGTFALNTYEWEYAPYMTAWLRYLKQHWIAPPAYTQLGIIHGSTYVKFRIYPDGHMETFELLQHTGHESLQLSSVNAVNASFPFKPLPDDFPDEYLEITLALIYPNLRQLVR